MNKWVLLFLASVCSAMGVCAEPVSVQSPNGRVTTSFDLQNGKLFYSVAKNGAPLVAQSKVEILKNAEMALIDQSVRQNDTSWKPVWGQFSSIRDHHQELTLSMTANGMPVTLLCRAFDSGIGIRFVLPAESAGKKLTFLTEYKVLDGAAHYQGQRGQDVKFSNKKPSRRNRGPAAPVVTVRNDGLHVGFLESDLYSATGFELMKIVASGDAYTAVSSATSQGKGQVTAWRTILIGDAAGDLSTNTIALNLSAPCKIADTSWIKPGKGLWDWRVHGYNNGDFVYGIDTRSCMRYIDFCAERGVEYFTLDDHWFKTAGNGSMVVAPEIDIEKIMSYAKEKGVKIMLYYDRHKGDFGDETLFSHYAELGAAGMKYGFMGNKSGFTRNAIEQAAENKLLINFHDGPVPMAGVERTFPNLICREYCHGQQDSRSAFTPETFLKMAMVSNLSGPLDMSNGNFGINSINAGEREKGPKVKNSYISTVVSEVARNLVIYTGLVTLPDAPEEYRKKLDLFEFMKAMPATWDDSRVLNSKIGSYITTARRSGETWFVASVNNQEARTLNVPLDFLESDKSYEATLYEDAPDSHGLKNPEAYVIKTITVKQGDMVPAKMAVGGGHAMIIRPKK